MIIWWESSLTIKHFSSLHKSKGQTGWDFHWEPGILVPTKSWCLTQNLFKSYCTSSQKFSCVWEKWKQEENNSHRKKWTGMKKFPVAIRNFVSREWILYCRKKLPVIGRYILSYKDNSFYWKKFAVTIRNLLSQEAKSCHRMKVHVAGKKFMSQEKIHVSGIIFKKIVSQKENSQEENLWVKISCNGKNNPVLSQEENSS